MVRKLIYSNKPHRLDFELGKPKLPTLLPDIDLVNLVGPNSWLIFQILKINTNWMAQPAITWKLNLDFCKFENYVKSIRVVNDIAERGIRLCSEYMLIMTKDEEKRKQIYQVVEDQRKRICNRDKEWYIPEH